MITILVPLAPPPSVGEHGGSCRNLGLGLLVTRGHLAKFGCPNAIPMLAYIGVPKIWGRFVQLQVPHKFYCATRAPVVRNLGHVPPPALWRRRLSANTAMPKLGELVLRRPLRLQGHGRQ